MRFLAILAAMILLSSDAAFARGSHGGSHHSSSGGGHRGAGTHYSHSYVTQKGTYVHGGYRHYPKKKR